MNLTPFVAHGAEMASEIPSSEKADGFNQYWKANYAGQGYTKQDKAAARSAYNEGWRLEKSGEYEPKAGDWFKLFAILGACGLVLWMVGGKGSGS